MTMLRRTFAPGVLLLALMAASCGTESNQAPFSPDSTFTLPRMVAFEPVPTDLVIAVDVSDSTNADELAATVDALIATLTDASVFDPAGTASVAVVVYGDTTAAVLTPLTTLDTASGTGVFAPALVALETDRLVGGGAAVLDEAIEAAAALLAGGSSGNAHVVVIGGGQDVDPVAVTARCAELAAAGIRFHAVGLGASEAAATLLSDCAASTGGTFAGALSTEAIGTVMRTILSRVTVVQLELLPDTAEVNRGAGHTVTAYVTRGVGDDALALAGLVMTFEVTDGPSIGTVDTVVTDAMGVATFSLTGDVPSGTDTIVARLAHPDGDVVLSAFVTVTWLNQAPVCAVGGPYLATVLGDTVRVMLDASASTDADGDPLTYLWSVEGDGIVIVDAQSAITEVILTGDATCGDSLEIAVAISDGFDTTMCAAQIVLEDQRAPVLVAKDETLVLWSPNHKLHTVTPGMVLERVEDACGSLSLEDVVVLSVTSDEAFDARGSGNSAPDVLIGCDGSVQLRSERTGGGDGRVYTIEYAVTDDDGNTSTLLVAVHVPHDQSGRFAIDSGVAETVMADCDGQAR